MLRRVCDPVAITAESGAWPLLVNCIYLGPRLLGPESEESVHVNQVWCKIVDNFCTFTFLH